jgi:hypothetical protein
VRKEPRSCADRQEQTHSALAERWLTILDVEVRQMPRASDWLDYPCFWLVRYPRLRPSAAGRNASDRAKFEAESSSTAFWEYVGNWKRRISNCNDTRRASDDLTAKQRAQLAALLVDIDSELYEHRDRAQWHKRLQKLDRQASRRQRMLIRKLKKTHQSFNQIVEYGRKPDTPKRILDAAINRARATHADLHQYRRGLDSHLRKDHVFEGGLPCPSQVAFPDFGGLLKDPESHSNPVRPVSWAMVRIYAFFVRGCGLSQDEAEVRVGLLRNAFWSRYGVARVEINARYRSAESAGCPAVKAAVRHFVSAVLRK